MCSKKEKYVLRMEQFNFNDDFIKLRMSLTSYAEYVFPLYLIHQHINLKQTFYRLSLYSIFFYLCQTLIEKALYIRLFISDEINQITAALQKIGIELSW